MTTLPPPPRRIPHNTAVQGLFGGLRYQVSWLMLGFSTVFLLGFAIVIATYLEIPC